MTDAVRIKGGIDAEPQSAVIGNATLYRAPTEALEAFEVRALAVAEASGAEFVVIGGLPAPDEGAEAAADALAEKILAATVAPDAGDYGDLLDYVTFAQRTGIFAPSPRHLAALDRLPAGAPLVQ
jgi:hypothetical protein